MSRNISVAVLMGGMSSEHDVSLNSGQGVVQALQGDRYTPLPVTITREGLWQFPDGASLELFDAIPHLRDMRTDCVFIALHGAFGEDGRIQGLLDLLGLPYTGSGCAASALAMDKVRCKAVVQAEDIRIGAHLAFGPITWRESAGAVLEKAAQEIGFPCVVKPACQGSSVGVYIPRDAETLRKAVDAALAMDDAVMIEQFIQGKEVTCGVLDVEPGRRPRALPLTEIRPKTAAFFDYEAKYTPGASEEITPAEVDAAVAAKIQEMAVHVHAIVGCKGWSRSDFIIDGEGPVWLEVNTVPGLTRTSLFPQACAAVGISYAQMVSLFVEAALQEKQRKAS